MAFISPLFHSIHIPSNPSFPSFPSYMNSSYPPTKISERKKTQNAENRNTSPPQPQFASSDSTLILKIITSSPIVTIINSVKLNHPMTIALVPTPLLTLPLPKSSAMMEAATEAVCCQRTETRTKIAAMKMMARATCETGREGKGLTSRSEPSESVSSCQTGKVARRRTQMKAKMIAMILKHVS